jgi:FlaA1/EpsC-like NDP-sugar epimerase
VAQRALFYAKLALAMALDAVLVNVSMYFALFLRFDTPHVPSTYLLPYLHVATWFTLGTIALFFGLRIYHRLWQYASVLDGLMLGLGVTLSALWLAALIYAHGGAHYSRAVFALYWLVGLVLLGGTRFVRKSVHDVHWRRPRRSLAPRVLILGAGKAGQLVARELARHPEAGQAVGFLDDDPQKRGMQLNGLRVVGGIAEMRAAAERYDVDQVIIAMPSVAGVGVRKLVDEARSAGIRARILPALNQVIDGRVHVNQIRDVQIEDLLQRAPADIDLGEIASYVTGRTVLVTGAGGTIGGELARQVAAFAPRQLVLLGLDETSVFSIEQELKERHRELDLVPVVADLRDRAHLERLFQHVRPQVIFHAAAHKHVPLMEAQPDEAVRNNVGGLWALADLADRYRSDKFVFISTDKAVNPTSVYGATKRVGELLVTAYAARSSTRFVTVRFGNVLGSRGSVVPTFQRQIQSGGPVTVTHPEMTRYFMTAVEAAQLVVQAGAMGQGGEIFVLDMGEPIRILDLAMNLIRLSGLTPGQDIEIVFTGVRPGEKLYEEPLTREDRARASRHERIFVARQDPVDSEWVLKGSDQLLGMAESGEALAVVEALRRLVPEYRPNRADWVAGADRRDGRGSSHAVERGSR